MYGLSIDRSSRRAMELLAQRFTLELRPHSFFFPSSASGREGGFQIAIDHIQEHRNVLVRIRVSGCKPAHLRIAPESLSTAIHKHLGGVDVEIGDPELDAAAQISGIGEDWIRACLDEKARRAVLVAIRSGASLEDGTWTCTLPRTSDANELEDRLRAMLAASRALGFQSTLKARLQRLAESDPLPLVRERALDALLREKPSPAWLAERCKDPHVGVVLVAATALGEEGRSALVARLGDPDGGVRLRAAVALSRLPFGPEAKDLEATLIAQITVPPHALEAIDALGAVGSAAALAALTAIVPSGSVASLGLTERTQRAGVAIQRIRERAGETAGAVSIAAQTEEGSLSVASGAPPGGVSHRSREGA